MDLSKEFGWINRELGDLVWGNPGCSGAQETSVNHKLV